MNMKLPCNVSWQAHSTFLCQQLSGMVAGCLPPAAFRDMLLHKMLWRSRLALQAALLLAA